MLKLIALLLPACLFATLPVAAQSKQDLVDRLAAARALSQLTDKAIKPWHLAVTFDLLDAKGAVVDHGTFDELWVSPHERQWRYTSAGYTATQTTQASKTFRTSGKDAPPELLSILQSELEHPLPSSNEVEASIPHLQAMTISKVPLDCIILAPPHTPYDPAIGRNPTFCFGHGSPDLRLFVNFGAQQIVRNTIGHFQGKSVALDFEISESLKPVLRAHVDQLTTFDPAAITFHPNESQEQVAARLDIGSSVAAGYLRNNVAPAYPEDARRAHLSGAVALRAVIGKDGRIETLVPIRSPAMSLTESAVKAVRQWTYEPFRVDGEPMEVQTVITVNYNMGP